VQSAAEQLLFTVVRIEGLDKERAWVGTGFLYSVDTERGGLVLLVTNKHVLEGAVQIRIQMVRVDPDKEEPLLGERSEIVLADFDDESWIGHPDPAVDVAILPLNDELDKLNNRRERPFMRSLVAKLFMKRNDVRELDVVEEIVFVGYPNGIFDSRNLLPVFRRGMTATPFAIDYEGEPAFLVDASVFPGSSGSPVFILDRGTYSPWSGGLVFQGRMIFLGVLAAVHIREVQGRVTELPARLLVEVEDTLDLGIVYKSWTVDECVDKLLHFLGVKRLERDEGDDGPSDPEGSKSGE
jgi:hypothetical protein